MHSPEAFLSTRLSQSPLPDSLGATNAQAEQPAAHLPNFQRALDECESEVDDGRPAPMVGSEERSAAHHRRCGMAKVLKCGDLMPGCNFVAEGKDVAEVMAKGAEHAKTAHGMSSIPPDVAAKVQAAIKDK